MNLSVNLDQHFFTEKLSNSAHSFLPKAAAALTALKNKKCVGSEWTGWFDYPQQRGFALVNDVKNFVKDLSVDYDLVLVIGIGGSYLGTRAVADALTHTYAGALSNTSKNTRRSLIAYAGHHLSESGLAEVLDLLEHRNPIVNVISKSGTTTEPGVAFRIIRDHLQKKYSKEELAKRIVATTDSKKGALRQLSNEAGYKTFEVPSDIGGRYSVLSAVGLVPLALAGFSIENLMEGAATVFEELKKDGKDHPALQYACCRMAAYEAKKQIEILSYAEPKLSMLIEWWRQLFGESEGKNKKGLFPAGMGFTTDLHSLGQYVQEGTRNIFETFLVFEEGRKRLKVPEMGTNIDELEYLEGKHISEINRAAMLATKIAHYDGEVPCLELQTGTISEKTIGSLFAFFETVCALGGALLEVNPFDQPGVESYKKNLFALMGKPGFEELQQKLQKRL